MRHDDKTRQHIHDLLESLLKDEHHDFDAGFINLMGELDSTIGDRYSKFLIYDDNGIQLYPKPSEWRVVFLPLPKNKSIWLVTSGSGADGDEWGVISIHGTKATALTAKKGYEQPHKRNDGSTYRNTCDIEEWPIEL